VLDVELAGEGGRGHAVKASDLVARQPREAVDVEQALGCGQGGDRLACHREGLAVGLAQLPADLGHAMSGTPGADDAPGRRLVRRVEQRRP
jgi:hypothetical protein